MTQSFLDNIMVNNSEVCHPWPIIPTCQVMLWGPMIKNKTRKKQKKEEKKRKQDKSTSVRISFSINKWKLERQTRKQKNGKNKKIRQFVFHSV